MMNGVTGVGASNQNYQMTFGNRKMRKAEWMIVDAMNDALTKEPRSLAEKTELAKLKAVSLLAQKFNDSFVSKIVEKGKGAIEHIKSIFGKQPRKDTVVELIEGEVKAGKLEPDKARTILINHHIGSDDLVTVANELSRQNYLDELAKKDPELYKEVLRRDAEHKVANMSTFELLREFCKSIIKKS